MENKSCNVNDILAKGKCINDFFSNHTESGGNSITHRWILISTTLICEVMCGTAALWVDGSAGCAVKL